MSSVVVISNESNSIHISLFTLRETGSVHDSMNRPKLNLLLTFTFYFISQVSFFQFLPNLAGFPDILN